MPRKPATKSKRSSAAVNPTAGVAIGTLYQRSPGRYSISVSFDGKHLGGLDFGAPSDTSALKAAKAVVRDVSEELTSLGLKGMCVSFNGTVHDAK